MVKIGYAFWSHQADTRISNSSEYDTVETFPLHTFSIINGFLNANHSVFRLYPDRDDEYIRTYSKQSFKAFSQNERSDAYLGMHPCLHNFRDVRKPRLSWPNVDVVLMEWRPNTFFNTRPYHHDHHEPDMFLQDALIAHYTEVGVPIICLDTNCNMPVEKDSLFHAVLDFSFRRGVYCHVNVPFNVKTLTQFQMVQPIDRICYVADKVNGPADFVNYFQSPYTDFHYHVYGKWSWSEQDIEDKYKLSHVNFHPSVQPRNLYPIYKYSTSIPLLMNEDQYKFGLINSKFLEILLFGSLPLIPTSFQSPNEYVPTSLRIANTEEMIEASCFLYHDIERIKIRKQIIRNMQQHETKFFVDKFISML